MVMAEGKDRTKALESFDLWVNGPLEGWEAADRRLVESIQQA